MTQAEITSHFVQEIIDGKLSINDTNKRIREYEEKYGADFFADYDVEKKGKPWDDTYLKDLELKSMAGMASKQFILHLAEVSEYVHYAFLYSIFLKCVKDRQRTTLWLYSCYFLFRRTLTR